MKRFGMKFSATTVAIVCLGVLASTLLAAPPSWRWRVDVIPAAGTNEVTLLASTGGQIEWVRFNRIDGPTNQASSAVTLISGADAYSTSIGGLTVSNETDAVSQSSGISEATNAQWRAGDKVRVESAGVTNGTVAVGYWYYE